MRTIFRSALLAATLPVLLTSSLLAQHRRHGIVDVSDRSRQGFWLALGVGAGGDQVDLQDGFGYSNTLTEPTVQLRLGGTVNQHLRLGAELSSWLHSYYTDNGKVLESVGGVFGIAQWYPSSRAGFYLKGGAGLGRSALDYYGGPTISDLGFAAVLGAGYDIRVGRHLAITPTVDFQFHDFSGAEGGGYKERIGAIGLGLTYQAGGF